MKTDMLTADEREALRKSLKEANVAARKALGADGPLKPSAEKREALRQKAQEVFDLARKTFGDKQPEPKRDGQEPQDKA